METHFSSPRFQMIFCSYPTYEEWKPIFGTYSLTYGLGSYPTYEEWKHIIHNFIILFSSFSSYPTYEEWKLESSGGGG